MSGGGWLVNERKGGWRRGGGMGMRCRTGRGCGPCDPHPNDALGSKPYPNPNFSLNGRRTKITWRKLIFNGREPLIIYRKLSSNRRETQVNWTSARWLTVLLLCPGFHVAMALGRL